MPQGALEAAGMVAQVAFHNGNDERATLPCRRRRARVDTCRDATPGWLVDINVHCTALMEHGSAPPATHAGDKPETLHC